MSEPAKNPRHIPESYSPKTPEIAKIMGELRSETVVDTVVIEGVKFTVIEKGKTFIAGAYADETVIEPDFDKHDTDNGLLFERQKVDEIIQSIKDSVTPDRKISLNIDYTTTDRPCAMLIGQETTSREQPEGVHVIEAEPTLLIKVDYTHASYELTKRLTGKCVHQYQLSELFGLIKHIFCEGEQAEYEYNGDNGSGNCDAEYHIIAEESVGYAGDGYVTVPVKRRSGYTGALKMFAEPDKNARITEPVTPRKERDIQRSQVSKEFEKISFGGRDWLVLDECGNTALIMTETVDYKRFH